MPRDLVLEYNCKGELLASCEGPYTGPSCTLPCDVPGAGDPDDTGVPLDPPDDCGFELYCHSDGSVYGLSTKKSFLWQGSPSASNKVIENTVKQWTIHHEEDLGLAPNLSLTDIDLRAGGNFRSRDGSLTVFRFSQYYKNIRVLDPDGQVIVTYTPDGAVSISGKIVDRRSIYANTPPNRAAPQKAGYSIRHHVRGQTGLATADFRIRNLSLVAIPQAQAIGYSAFVDYANGAALARVLVDADAADPAPVLELWDYRRAEHDGLAQTQAITVRTLDPSFDPVPLPQTLSDENTLTDGAPLLGSIDDVSMDVQLATNSVVVLDLQGESVDDLHLFASRVLSPNWSFLSSSGADFVAQASHALLSDWYAYLDGFMTDPVVGAKRWDSANPHYSNGSVVPQAAVGTFTPRLLGFTNSASNDCPPSAVACASFSGIAPNLPAALAFPEVSNVPSGATIPEVSARLSLKGTTLDAVTLAHEAGHAFDLILGGAITGDMAPACGGACTAECVEDTSDEAPPLGETIAQMFAMILLHRTFEPLDFEYCGIVDQLATSGTGRNDPGPCMPLDDSVGRLVRPESPACTNSGFCDKPNDPGFVYQCCFDDEDQSDCTIFGTGCSVGTSNGQGGETTGWARPIPTGVCFPGPDGYNTFSVMQAFWQMLNGYSCEPTAPFACQTVAWPNGIQPDAAVVPAFLHAIRLAPLTYRQLFDNMATYVACNYGEAAYAEFNEIACNHALRSCGEPAPTSCGTCGNGVREGNQECDGYDWVVTSCDDFLYFSGGTLQCHASGTPDECRLEFSGCQAASTSMTSGLPSPDTTDGAADATGDSGSGDSGGTGVSSDGGGASDGCSCSSGRTQRAPLGFLLLAFLGIRSRRRTALTGLAWSLAGCGDDVSTSTGASSMEAGAESTVDAASESSIGESASVTTEGSSRTGAPFEIGPWVGSYHFEDALHPFGELNPSGGAAVLGNLEIYPDQTAFATFEYCSDEREIHYRVEPLTENTLRVLRGQGETSLRYNGATDLEDLVIVRTAPCRLVFEIDGAERGFAENWQPGVACWLDRCETPNHFRVDYCEETEPPPCP